jgi:23S rRNA (adenine2503-C2)-methyltransferase
MKYRAKYYSKDGTIKYLMDVPVNDPFIKSAPKYNLSIESAMIHLDKREENKPEYILCLSSQVGCVYKCLMCKNMFNSFYRQLTPNELNQQINLTLSQDNNLEKIVSKGSVEYAFMAMGEPLFGNNVIRAIKQHKPIVPNTRFALSTVGAPGTIKRLTKSELPYPVRLEISLHFSNDRLRNEWMRPDDYVFQGNHNLNINKALEEAQEYAQKSQEKITLNYMLIDAINNMDRNISEIEDLLKNKTDTFYVKVMWPNLTSSLVYSWKDELREKKKTCSPREFKEKLLEKGIPATLFESKGKDISAGCGMMTSRFCNKKGIIESLEIPEADPSKLGWV